MDPTFIIIGVIIALLVIQDWRAKSKRRPNLPGPSYLIPFIGNYLEVTEPDTGSTHKKWTDQYGPTVCYYVFGRYRVLVTEPADVKHVLLNNHLFDKNLALYRSLSQILGNGLVTEWDEGLHKYHRSIVSPAFAHSHLRGLVPIFQEKGRIVVEDWMATAGTGTPVDIKTDIAKATSDVIGEAAFDYKLHSQRNNSSSSIYHLFADLIGGGINIFDVIPLIKYFSPAYRRRIQATHTLDSQVKIIIDQKEAHRMQKKEEKEVKSETKDEEEEEKRKKRDLLDILMECANEEGAMLTKEELAGQVKTFLLAGYETSSTCILWTLYLLSNNLDIQQKLADEVRSIIGKDRKPAAEDIDKMPYLHKVVQESLRVCPPIPVVVRQASEDVTIRDIHIPKGTHMLISIYHQHHDPKSWKDPETFNPDRWSNNEADAAQLGAYVPFIMGARNCIGNRFALLEVRVMLAMIVQQLSFLPQPGQKYPGRKSLISMTPKIPIKLTFERRD